MYVLSSYYHQKSSIEAYVPSYYSDRRKNKQKKNKKKTTTKNKFSSKSSNTQSEWSTDISVNVGALKWQLFDWA